MAFTKHCVLLFGYARAGKDTFAKGLIAGASKPIDTTSLAAPLKEALRIAAHDVGIDVNYGREEDKLQDRPLLVEFGRAMRRRDKDVFANAVVRNLGMMMDEHTYVITDGRYFNEFNVIKEACDTYGINLHTVLIVRNGWGPANDEESTSMHEVINGIAFDETVHATSGDEEAVLLAGIRTAKLWNL